MGSSGWSDTRRLAAALAVAAVAAAPPAGAASSTGAFRVTVDLTTDNKVVVQCDRTTTPVSEGNAVNVTCVDNQVPTSASTPRNDPRFLLQLQRGGGTVGTVEGLVPPGTVASWRVINGSDRDYLEIVVGW